MRWLVPETLFGRLFAAIVGVIALTLMVIVALVVRERREFAFAASGAGAVATSIADTSTYLAQLPAAERARELTQLRSQRVIERMRMRRPMPHRESSPAAERAFAEQIQRQLGGGYRVSAGPPRTPPHRAILVEAEGDDPFGMEPPPPPREGTRPIRMFDIAVALPDGDRVIFRTAAPRAGPPLPRQLFFQLGALTLILGIVLYAMTRTITRPLAELARAADAVGRGTQIERLEERGARELKAATQAFNAMHERLNRYLDSRTRVLAAMSHDLRTPLTRLRLRVESIEDDDLRQRCADDLDEMARMVRGALSVFRGLNDEEEPVTIDVDALLIELQRQYGEMGERVSVEGSAKTQLTARPLALKRCLSNLIDNALRYGTQAIVRVEDGANLIVRILDDGPGIPAEALEQVFEPFFRLESSRSRESGGTGLGLSIARDIAQSHGGSLTLANRAEGGLVATLVLPRG